MLTANTASAQPGSRICLTHHGHGRFIAEIRSHYDCGKMFFMTGAVGVHAFTRSEYTCERIGRWSTTHSFGRRDDDICDGMRRASVRNNTYHEILYQNGYDWDWINNYCPDASYSSHSLSTCSNVMAHFRQVTNHVYNRTTAVRMNPPNHCPAAQCFKW